MICSPLKINYYKEDTSFGIVRCSLIRTIKGKVQLDSYKMITILGNMPEPIKNKQYYVRAIEEKDDKFGVQYKLENISLYLPEGIENPIGRKVFLTEIFTEQQVEEMYKAYDDPYQIFIEKDAEKLVQIKGCGMKTAYLWIKKFYDNYNYTYPILALKDLKITDNLMRKVVNICGSPELAVKKIIEDPYSLINISGIGWFTCDEIAKQTGAYNNIVARLKAYIKYYLKNMAENGYSYIPTDMFSERQLEIGTKNGKNINLMDNLIQFFGEDLEDESIRTALNELEKDLWFSQEHTSIGLQYYRILEEKIASELLRIRDSNNIFNYDNAEEIILNKEKKQGWSYTEQQKEAIYAALENQLILITGLAGTGKSTIISAILEILSGYSFAQTAVAGRAAARMSEITGSEGYTIHRLLKYPLGDTEHGRFAMNKDNPLMYDIVILDEISMVDGKLFLRLLEAIPKGTKLIMLGDVGQLECIGSLNIANDLLNSPSIKSIELTEILRQAKDSAIITEGYLARKGEMIVPKDWTGTEVRGKLEDLVLECYTDSSNTFYRIMQYVAQYLEEIDNIMDLIVIVPNKEQQAGVHNINLAIQELYNPSSTAKKEIVVQNKDNVWTIREGDKVINTENNYNIITDKGVGIYNGNIGVIKKIDPKKQQVTVYFSDLNATAIIPKKHLKALELGYCITCHKIEGSQCKNVIIGLDFSSYVLLTRQWVYTAISRTVSKCVLIAQTSALRYALHQDGVSIKVTHLQSILYELDHPKYIF